MTGTAASPFSGDLIVDGLDLRGRVLLAPMAGVTDAGMRRIAAEAGATLTVTEMVAAASLSRGETETLIRAERQGSGPHAVQIAGCNADHLAEAARLAEGAGADLIDINMGCPAKRVTGGYAGSALMRNLGHAAALIRATVAAVSVPVSVKMRLGWDDSSLNAPALARIAEAEGVRLVTVHGRTRCQFYQGAADWHAVHEVKRAVTIPIVVNGDCRNASDARRMLAASGADAVMVGRAAVGQPWIVGDFARDLAGAVPELRTAAWYCGAARAHYESLLRAFGREKGKRHARKHLAGYAEYAVGSVGAEAWRRELVTSDDPDEVLRLLDRLFLSTPGPGDVHHARAA